MQDDMKASVVAITDGIIDRFDRINRRLVAIVILLIVLLVGSNVAWLIYESQFADLSYEVSQEADNGINNFASDNSLIFNGSDTNGETNSQNN